MLKKKTEHLDLKITEQESTHIESETLTQVLNEVKSELEDLKMKQKSESSPEIKCNECDINVRNYSELKGHIRQYHSHTRGSQYEKDCDLEDYPCFYCDKLITSPANLETHKTVCCEIGSFACDEWRQECFCGEELGGHVKTNQETFFDDQGGGAVQCDTCPLYFDSDCNLEFHRRGCHWDHM